MVSLVLPNTLLILIQGSMPTYRSMSLYLLTPQYRILSARAKPRKKMFAPPQFSRIGEIAHVIITLHKIKILMYKFRIKFYSVLYQLIFFFL